MVRKGSPVQSRSAAPFILTSSVKKYLVALAGSMMLLAACQSAPETAETSPQETEWTQLGTAADFWFDYPKAWLNEQQFRYAEDQPWISKNGKPVKGLGLMVTLRPPAELPQDVITIEQYENGVRLEAYLKTICNGSSACIEGAIDITIDGITEEDGYAPPALAGKQLTIGSKTIAIFKRNPNPSMDPYIFVITVEGPGESSPSLKGIEVFDRLLKTLHFFS